MKKYSLLFFMAFIGWVPIIAQNLVYDANAQVRKVERFSSVDVAGGINLYLSQGKQQGVAVSAEDAADVSKIKTEVKNGKLKIYVDHDFWRGWHTGNKHIKAYVTVTELKSLELSGGSTGKLTDVINVNDLELDLSGGSVAEGKINGNNLSMDLSGGSIATLSGTFSAANMQASGGSIVKAFDTNFDNCKIEASGGSIISITLNKEMSAEASGGSIITYQGSGVIKSIGVSGGSVIKKRDDAKS